jgi:hypothetical protein
MLRAVAVIVSAILMSRPEMPVADAERYARVLQAEAKAHDFDPLTGVAIIHFESGWQPRTVSASGEDYGLAQIRARYIGACRADSDPLREPSPECRKVKRELLEPENNIRTMAQLITNNRKLCKEKTGSPAFARWLASYQGLNFPKQNRWCVPKAKTWQVIRYREKLIRAVAAHKRPKPGAPAQQR